MPLECASPQLFKNMRGKHPRSMFIVPFGCFSARLLTILSPKQYDKTSQLLQYRHTRWVELNIPVVFSPNCAGRKRYGAVFPGPPIRHGRSVANVRDGARRLHDLRRRVRRAGGGTILRRRQAFRQVLGPDQG